MSRCRFLHRVAPAARAGFQELEARLRTAARGHPGFVQERPPLPLGQADKGELLDGWALTASTCKGAGVTATPAPATGTAMPSDGG